MGKAGARKQQEQAALLAALPCFRLALNPRGVFSLYPRKSMAPGSTIPTGSDLLDAGLCSLESPEGYIEDVVLNDEQSGGVDRARSSVHKQALRLLCGPEAVTTLENAPMKRMTTSAWLTTGGDMDRAAEGVGPLLHTLAAL